MSTDTALIEKREELKRRLAAGEYKTLIDIFLEWFDRLIRKITRQSKPLPLWLITVILGLVLYLVANATIYLAGDWNTSRKSTVSLGLGSGIDILLLISIDIVLVSSAIIINHRIGRLIILWHDNLMDATETMATLEDFEDWLKKTCNWRLHLLMTIIVGILSGLYWIAATPFTGYGIISGNIIKFMFSSAAFYLFFMVILLSVRLRRYDLKLFAADPSSSELVSLMSGELGFVVYFVAVYGIILALLVSLAAGFFDPSLGIVIVLFQWLPIVSLFVLNQTSLSSIIRRAKWKTLNEAQAKIEKLRASKSFGSLATMDAISKLMDYHDRVKATRNSSLNSGTILNFINSLLLPLLAFLLGNLDKLMALLTKKP